MKGGRIGNIVHEWNRSCLVYIYIYYVTNESDRDQPTTVHHLIDFEVRR